VAFLVIGYGRERLARTHKHTRREIRIAPSNRANTCAGFHEVKNCGDAVEPALPPVSMLRDGSNPHWVAVENRDYGPTTDPPLIANADVRDFQRFPN